MTDKKEIVEKEIVEKEESHLCVMGSCCVKQELTEEEIQFLKMHTRFDIDKQTIRDWYAGFLQVQLLKEMKMKDLF